MKNRRLISFLDDVVEEAYGEATPEKMEMVKLLFEYMIDEIKTDTDSMGFFIPFFAWLSQNYYLTRGLTYKQFKSEKQKDTIVSRLGDIAMVADGLGGLSPNRRVPLLQRQLHLLRKKYNLPSADHRIHPLYLTALEDLQNKSFNKYSTKTKK